MALLEDLTKNTTPTGLAMGLGATLLAPVLVPTVSRTLRPAAKALMRTGITLYRGAMEPLSATVGNLVAEAQLELAAASAGPVPAPVPEAAEPAAKAHRRRTAHHQQAHR